MDRNTIMNMPREQLLEILTEEFIENLEKVTFGIADFIHKKKQRFMNKYLTKMFGFSTIDYNWTDIDKPIETKGYIHKNYNGEEMIFYETEGSLDDKYIFEFSYNDKTIAGICFDKLSGKYNTYENKSMLNKVL